MFLIILTILQTPCQKGTQVRTDVGVFLRYPLDFKELDLFGVHTNPSIPFFVIAFVGNLGVALCPYFNIIPTLNSVKTLRK